MSEGALTSKCSINVQFLRDDTVLTAATYDAADNDASPASEFIYTLASGANTITAPTGGSTVKGALIIPPDSNTAAITLKGVTGDTGIPLSKLNPTFLEFETVPATFVLTAGATITGLRIIWT
jgi:hypothetical protein